VQGCTQFTTVIAENSWVVELDGEANSRNIHTTIRASMSPYHNITHEEAANSYDGGPARTASASDYKRVTANATPTSHP
jgi:hypothetical protein